MAAFGNPFTHPPSDQPRLRELEAVAARLRGLTEEEQLELYPKIAAVREAKLTEDLVRRG